MLCNGGDAGEVAVITVQRPQLGRECGHIQLTPVRNIELTELRKRREVAQRTCSVAQFKLLHGIQRIGVKLSAILGRGNGSLNGAGEPHVLSRCSLNGIVC